MYLSIYPISEVWISGVTCALHRSCSMHGSVRSFHASRRRASTDTSALLLPPLVTFPRPLDLLVIEGERRRACDRASMEMHVLPFVVPLVPHAALLALVGVSYALSAKHTNRHFFNPSKSSNFPSSSRQSDSGEFRILSDFLNKISRFSNFDRRRIAIQM